MQGDPGSRPCQAFSRSPPEVLMARRHVFAVLFDSSHEKRLHSLECGDNLPAVTREPARFTFASPYNLEGKECDPHLFCRLPLLERLRFPPHRACRRKTFCLHQTSSSRSTTTVTCPATPTPGPKGRPRRLTTLTRPSGSVAPGSSAG